MSNADATKPPDGFYVYTLAYPDGQVFYVGKGCGPRIHQHEQEARRTCNCYKCRVIRGIWRNGEEVVKSFVFATRSEAEAYQHERDLIAAYGLPNLANLAPGGTSSSRRVELPDKLLTEITFEEYSAWLWKQRRMTEEAFAERMVEWLHKKAALLRREVKGMRIRYRCGYATAEELKWIEDEYNKTCDYIRSVAHLVYK